MNKKILLLFIFSFLCVIYTVNNICYKYVDTKVDKVFITKFQTEKNINDATVKTIKNITIGEKTRLFIALTSGCLFFIVFSFCTKIYSTICLIFFIIAYFISYKLLQNTNIQISLASPLLSTITAFIYSRAYTINFRETIGKKIENVLSKYISKDIKNKILRGNNDVKLGGKKSEITIMFADIRGFTSLSETIKAEEVSRLLNEYFTELEPIINKYNGVINKYIGDAILVVFGDPINDKKHAQNAVRCAYELREKVKILKQRWITEGKPKIDIGIGINTGEAFIGNVGTNNRFEYTVIGDTVNIASRIEDYNKIYKTNLLISENTYNKISQIVDVIKIREVSIKGKSKKINIYEVLRITE